MLRMLPGVQNLFREAVPLVVGTIGIVAVAGLGQTLKRQVDPPQNKLG